MCFFTKKIPDTINLTNGTVNVNGFLLDAWTSDDLFMQMFQDVAEPSKKQATYVLSDVQSYLNDITFNSIMVQFSPIGLQNQRVIENMTMYVQPCKHSDFLKRVANRCAALPGLKVLRENDEEYAVEAGTMRICARVDDNTRNASLNLEYLDSQTRVNHWVEAPSMRLLTPKSGALYMNGHLGLANLRETQFKTEIMPYMGEPEACTMDGNVSVYTFKHVQFYDLEGMVKLTFKDNKLCQVLVNPADEEVLDVWANRHFGNPLREDDNVYEYTCHAAGSRCWRIRVHKHQPKMEMLLSSQSMFNKE